MAKKFTLAELVKLLPDILIDEEDLTKFGSYIASLNGDGYVQLYIYPKTVSLHRAVMGFPNSKIDHKDRNKLNCEKQNLRLATASQNNQNASIRSDNTSGYKGVFFKEGRNAWVAGIRANGKLHFSSYYRTPELAAKAYNAMAKYYFGEFACLNDVPE